MLNDLKSSEPTGFSGFAGNRPAVEAVEKMLRAGRIPHAILLEGENGAGKQTFARLIAKAAVCTGEIRPCGVCRDCVKAQAGAHPDITLLSGGEAARSLHVDAIRALRQDAYIIPGEANRKVYILLQAQAMTQQAQNALLKILEEPPAAVLFILSCEMRAQLLDTIVSRVFTLSIGEVSADQAVSAVSRLRVNIGKDEILAAYAKTGGNIGRILSILDAGEDEAEHLAYEMLRAFVSLQELEMLKIAYRFERDRELSRKIFNIMLLVLSDAAAFREAGRPPVAGQADLSAELARILDTGQLLRCIELVNKSANGLRQNANGALLTSRLVAEMVTCAGK